MWKRVLLWTSVSAALVLVVVFGIGLAMLRPARLKAHAERTLSDRLNMDVTIAELDVNLLPRPRISGAGFVFRVRNRPDLAPFVSIDRFYANVGLFSAMRKHVNTVHLDGLKIVVPPPEARDTLAKPGGSVGSTKVIVEQLIAHDAELSFRPKKPGGRPLTFAIHDLTVRELGFDRAWPYDATLTNPVPKGLVKTTGSFGPWDREDVAESPLGGEYTLTDADLGTINGIGGTLQSTGKYDGRLAEIRATGESRTPDFSLDLGGKPLPLTTTFVAVIDGTNGTTVLEQVNARLVNTDIVARGAITNLEGPGRHDVRIESEIADGRVEDMLALAIDSKEPLLEGDLTSKNLLLLPPGPGKPRRRLEMSGDFGLGRAEFSDDQVQQKLGELSRRSQGKKPEEAIGRVLTSLRGKYHIKNGIVRLTDLRFRVPGATVAMAGTYNVDSGELDFRGTLRMQATVSQAVGGFKSIFLKPFDFMFRKEGAGAVIPIRLTGTKDAPKFGLEMGKVFKK